MLARLRPLKLKNDTEASQGLFDFAESAILL